jgi:hypothetical protein
LERAFNAWIGHSFPELGLILLYNNTFLRARMAEMTAVQLTAVGSFDPASAAPHIFDVV